MILESLFDLVNELRRRIEENGLQLRSNEMQTRYALIDPLLRELGWDTSDPSLVTPEFSASGGRADYALLKNGRPVVMVEAKKLGEDLQGAVTQGITYCIGQGTPHFAVTDGQRWEIYETHRPVPVEQKKVVSFDIVRNAAGAVCLEALALWKPGVLDNSVRRGSEPVVEPDKEPPPPPPREDARGSEWKSLDRSSLKLDGSGRNVQPVEIAFPDGSSLSVKYWWEVTTSVAGWLVDRGSLTTRNCPISLWQGRKCVIAASPNHPDGTAMTRAKPVRNLYIEANFSAADHVWIAKELIKHRGQDPTQFKLRFP